VSAFTDRLPRNFEADGGGVEGLLSAQHTGTTKTGNSSGMATVESSPRAPSWIDYARPPKILELEAAVAAAAAAAHKPFPDKPDLDASTTRGSPERAARESRRYGLVGMNGHAGHARSFSGSNGNGIAPLQPVFNAPPPPQHSPGPAPPPKDHFGTYPAGHTYATPGPGVGRAVSPPHGSVGRAASSLGRSAPPFGSRPQTADEAPRPFGSLSSRPSTAGAPASHPFNAVRTARPSTADANGHSGDRATSPTERATSPFSAAQWAKLQPVAAHASALSRLEGTAETYSLAHEARPPAPSFPGGRATSPEPRKRFSFRPTTPSRDKRKKRFSLLPEKERGMEISAPVPASDAPLPADAWPAGGVGSRLSGIAQTPLPPAPAVSALAVGKLSMHPDSSPAQVRDEIPERPASAASRRSRRWSFKPGKKSRERDEDAPHAPALPPVLPPPSNLNKGKGMTLSDSVRGITARPPSPNYSRPGGANARSSSVSRRACEP
jgi:hypothetical protein